MHYFFLGKCNPYESYLLHGLYFCAEKQPYLYLLPQCLTEMTVTRETGFQDEGQSLPAWRLWRLWRETDLCACGLPGNTGIPDYPRLHIFQYKGYESRPVYKTKWKTLFFSSLFFVFSLQRLWFTFPWVLAGEGLWQVSLCKMFGLTNENPFLAYK